MDPRGSAGQLRYFGAIAGALLAAGCATTPPEIESALRRGSADAMRDLEDGRPRLAWIGVAEAGDGPLDRETGLVRRSAGCCKGRELIAYCNAYNGVIGDARAAGRLEGVSLAHKATTRAGIEAHFAREQSVTLTLGAPGATSPGGRFVVEIAQDRAKDQNALWSTDRVSGVRDEVRFVGSERAQVVFADGGTTLYVRDDAIRAYESIDLPSRLLLQVFPDPERER